MSLWKLKLFSSTMKSSGRQFPKGAGSKGWSAALLTTGVVGLLFLKGNLAAYHSPQYKLQRPQLLSSGEFQTSSPVSIRALNLRSNLLTSKLPTPFPPRSTTYSRTRCISCSWASSSCLQLLESSKPRHFQKSRYIG